jgi:O-antigen ligase
MLEIANRREYALMSHAPSVLEIDKLSLRDDAGTEWLHNGEFSDGFDRWFTLYDFNHLPWHIKNMFVHLVFEHGLFGLAAVLAITGVAVWRGVRAVARGDLAAQAMILGIIGFGSVGMVGTLFDEPRILLLFMLFVLSLALAPTHHSQSARP